MYKLECKNVCWICPFNNKCIVQKKREQDVKVIFEGTKNEQKVRND